ncbi:DUF6660 family protein [Chitinophaga flava]|uniref:DUF6660 family protein n=1 Tax=Chitinophaga flava TaxID=2259036 RepID=UPI0011BF5149|nr:DUF6660 family protein [Chitinophaga flava]
MKWLIYIMSLYILVLSCIPCNDTQAVAMYNHTEVTATHEHNHETQVDFCSPLCVCSCCNVQVTPATSVILPYHMHQVQVIFPVLPVTPLPLSSNTIWQPPRL